MAAYASLHQMATKSSFRRIQPLPESHSSKPSISGVTFGVCFDRACIIVESNRNRAVDRWFPLLIAVYRMNGAWRV